MVTRNTLDNEDDYTGNRSRHSSANEDSPFKNPIFRLAAKGLLGVVGLTTLSGFFYRVSPSQMAEVQRMGHVVTKQPVGQGTHLKLPLIDSVDKLEVAQEALPAKITVNTVDNQQVTLDVTVLYTKPPASVPYLLYDIGKAGVGDIDAQIQGTIKDRTGKAFGPQNSLEISDHRSEISNNLKATLTKDLKTLYKIDVQDFQIDEINYSDSFKSYIEHAMQSKANAISAANKVAEAQSVGDQLRKSADAEAYATKARADAEAYSTRVKGQGQADAIKVQRSMFTNDKDYVAYVAATRWQGQLPTVTGNGSATVLQGVLGNIGAQDRAPQPNH